MREFSLKGYCDLLSRFKAANYSFCMFDEIKIRLQQKESFIVLRHDIDISLRPALQIARIEYEQEVKATYFVLINSPFYNVFAKDSIDIMLEIQRLGHQIAPHIDLTIYDNDFEKALVEVDILKKYYNFINTDVITLHSPYELSQIPVKKFRQLNNAYGASVKGDLAYISDSTGRWRYGHPLDSEAFKAQKPIQLLTHPIWWVQAGETVTQKLELWLYSEYLNRRGILKEFMPKLFRQVNI